MSSKTPKVPTEVAEVLGRSTVNGNQLKLPEQLDPKFYKKVDATLKLLGGKWNRSAAAHVFADVNDLPERIDSALMTGSFQSFKDFGAFYTPPEVVAIIQDEIEKNLPSKFVKDKTTFGLEPSAGDGRLAEVIAMNLGGRGRVDLIEIQSGSCEKLMGKGYRSVVQGDFMAFTRPRDYCLIVMNPPFLRNTGLKHIQRAASLLVPRGLLIAVFPTMQRGKLEDELNRTIEVGSFQYRDLPEEAFKAAGTNVATTLVTVLGKSS